MFGLFGSKKSSAPEWLGTVEATQERYFAFLDKLKRRMDEFGEAALEELEALFAQNQHQTSPEFYSMKSAIEGQLSNMRKKAKDAYDEHINPLYQSISYQIGVTDKHHSHLVQFRVACSNQLHNDFDRHYHHWSERVSAAGIEDLEAAYQRVVFEYERTKDRFQCAQCGGPITIEKIFWIDAYVACPHCQTQNTFSPGSEVIRVGNLAQALAEQRASSYLQAYVQVREKIEATYHARHKLKLSSTFEKNKSICNEQLQQIEVLTQERNTLIAQLPALYRTYIDSKYDAWININPDAQTYLNTRRQNDLEAYSVDVAQD